jgi:hypothetical protein
MQLNEGVRSSEKDNGLSFGMHGTLGTCQEESLLTISSNPPVPTVCTNEQVSLSHSAPNYDVCVDDKKEENKRLSGLLGTHEQSNDVGHDNYTSLQHRLCRLEKVMQEKNDRITDHLTQLSQCVSTLCNTKKPLENLKWRYWNEKPPDMSVWLAQKFQEQYGTASGREKGLAPTTLEDKMRFIEEKVFGDMTFHPPINREIIRRHLVPLIREKPHRRKRKQNDFNHGENEIRHTRNPSPSVQGMLVNKPPSQNIPASTSVTTVPQATQKQQGMVTLSC